MKEQLGKIAANPRHIKNRAEFDAFLELKTLPNTDADGNITNPSISIRQLYGEAGVAELWNTWVDNKDKDRERDVKQEKIHQNNLYQIGKEALQTEWKGDSATEVKIFRQLKAKGLDKTTEAKLKKYTVVNDANTILDDRRNFARVQIKDGDFYEDDYLSLPKSLQQEDEFKDAYVKNEALLKKVGITGSDLKTNAIQFIIKDILGEEISVTNNYSATNNLAWQEYRRDVIAEYRFNVSDLGMEYQKAWTTAVDTINDLQQGATTKTEFQKPSVFNKVFEAIQSGGAINNYIRSLQMSPEKTQETIEAVTDRLINFDPAAKRKDGTTIGPKGLGEFIMANVGFGKLVAAKKLAVEGEKTKTTTTIDTKEARELEAEDTVIDAKPRETKDNHVNEDVPLFID